MVLRKEKPKCLAGLYLEVGKWKGEYMGEDKMFSSTAYKRLVRTTRWEACVLGRKPCRSSLPWHQSTSTATPRTPLDAEERPSRRTVELASALPSILL